MGQQTDLEQSVMRTILWFSLFSYPLTVFEIWKWLLKPQRPYDLIEVYSILEKSDWLKQMLETSGGFYALKGKNINEMLKDRQVRFLDAERKYKSLRRIAKFFSLLPAVRSVGAVNTMAWWSTTPTSDIDLYVVTKPGSIWSSRFWLVLPFLLTGQRPMHHKQSKQEKNSFCFSFFSTTEHLQMEHLCFPRDYYMAFWVKSLVPILDRDGSFAIFHQENRWATRLLPNAHSRVHHWSHKTVMIPSILFQFKFLEPFFRVVQQRRLPLPLRKLANLDSRVVVTDEILKFHENDRRLQFRDAFESLLERYL
ncbi:TPA: hypothetical protein DCW61_03000 [Candidatus Uhrbacteria bacterium]|nr:hypothetical protein [Candidatus Uhrbacteria bacterium]